MFLTTIWHDIFYQPLFNLLIWLYVSITDQSLGLAVIFLTVMLRVALLPFTIVSMYDKKKNAGLGADIAIVEKEFANDSVLKKEEIRKILKRRKVHPWAKAISLCVQVFVLILLYQVFYGGMSGKKIQDILYASVPFPGTINTQFLGFNLAHPHNTFWGLLVAGILFIEIYIVLRRRHTKVSRTDLVYLWLFPASVFLFLWYLPMVKSLFVLTSLLFSYTIDIVAIGIGKLIAQSQVVEKIEQQEKTT